MKLTEGWQFIPAFQKKGYSFLFIGKYKFRKQISIQQNRTIEKMPETAWGCGFQHFNYDSAVEDGIEDPFLCKKKAILNENVDE